MAIAPRNAFFGKNLSGISCSCRWVAQLSFQHRQFASSFFSHPFWANHQSFFKKICDNEICFGFGNE